MVWNRIDLKNFAKDSMRKNYGACVLAAFLISLVLGLDAGTLSQLEDFEMYIPEGITVTVIWMTLLIAIFAGNVFTVGCCRFFVENREYRAPVSKVFHGFQSGHYTNAVWIMFLRDVKIVLWTFLFHYSRYCRRPMNTVWCLIFWQISRIFQLEMLLPYPGK